MSLNGLNDVIKSDKALNALVKITTVLEVGNVFHDVVDLALSLRVEGLLLGSFHLLYLLPQVFIVVHEVHLIVLGRVEVDYLSVTAQQTMIGLKVLINISRRRHGLS